MPDLTTNDAGVAHQSAMPDTLFHYTTASGLLGILNHAKIWATDLRFLNDSEELVYSQDVVAEAIRVMENPIDRPDHWAHQLGEAAVETFTRYQGYVLDELQSGEFGVYVTCFCESGNLLNQWRGVTV